MGIRKTAISNSTDYTVSYSDMRGVDFSPTLTDRRRFSYLENMYRDYESSGAEFTESIPGFRRIASFKSKVHAIYSHKNSSGREYIVIHTGNELYRFPLDERDSLGQLTPIITLRDKKSEAFLSGGKLFILDGNNITRIDEEGNAVHILRSGEEPYVPTVYYNGEVGEQRNLLTNKFREKYLIESPDSYASGSEGIQYEITSLSGATCCVTGVAYSHAGELRVPPRVKIGTDYFSVTEIAPGAFKNKTSITDLYLPEGLLKIGSYAFSGCTALKYIVTPNSLDEIGDGAFENINTVMYFYLGSSVRALGNDIFASTQVSAISYGSNQVAFERIEGHEQLDNITVNLDARFSMIEIELPLTSSTKSVSAVTLNSSTTPFTVRKNGDRIKSVVISSTQKSALTGAEIVITAEGFSASEKPEDAPSFSDQTEEAIDGFDAIAGCTVCENFDGRVFLSGNPKLPNTVFYSSRDESGKNNPLYFGEYNYFCDGTGPFGVSSLLATGDSLAVFKSGDDGSGGIYYHTPSETSDDLLPKIYPVSYIHSGIVATGASISFFDDPVFVSSLGICALGKKAINLERSIAVRSHNVNMKLLSEDLKNIRLTKWCGYLVVAAGARYYLADSRQMFTHPTGNLEYEWYFLSGIGTYSDDINVFVYSENNDEDTSDSRVEKKANPYDVYSEIDENGKEIFYTLEGGVRYRVEKTEEMTEGSFSPSCSVFTCGDLLFFGTASGDLCVFNNDKRGVAPPYISENEDFDADVYKAENKGRIHPYFYSFNFHAPRYALQTICDNGGIPHLTKNTVKGSLAIKMRLLGKTKFTCEAACEKRGYVEICNDWDSGICFEDFDFAHLSFENEEYLTVPIKERERGWVEKKICIYSEEYESAFGVSSISYRFNVKGKIKRN